MVIIQLPPSIPPSPSHPPSPRHPTDASPSAADASNVNVACDHLRTRRDAPGTGAALGRKLGLCLISPQHQGHCWLQVTRTFGKPTQPYKTQITSW